MGGTENDNKRQRSDQDKKRKHDRHKFRKTTNATVHRKDLSNGLSGILFSCTPRHEQKCFKDAVILLDRFITPQTELSTTTKEPSKTTTDDKKEENDKTKETKPLSLESELNQIRDKKDKPFTYIEGGVQGCVFVKVNRPEVDLEKIAENALRDAKDSGNCSSRHCIRILPIQKTCYAKSETAAKTALEVVKNYFPPIQADDKPITYAIAFRSRMNTNSNRDDYITAIAGEIEKYEPRYKVNLSTPDVTLLVEVLKTSCCIGTFRHYFELAKMNLREAACPSKPKETKPTETEKESKVDEKNEELAATETTNVEKKDESNGKDVDVTKETVSNDSNEPNDKETKKPKVTTSDSNERSEKETKEPEVTT